VRDCYACQTNPADSKDPRYCKECYELGKEEDDSHLVEYYRNEFITLRGKRYPSIKLSANTQLCSECHRPIYEVPLLMWAQDGCLMVAFCHECAERLDLFALVRGGGVEDAVSGD